MPPRDIQLPAAIKQGHAVPVRSEQIIRVVFFGVLFDEVLCLELAGRFLGLQPIGKFVCGDIQLVDVHHQPAGDGVLVLGHNLHQIDFYVRIQQILDITHEKDYRDR